MLDSVYILTTYEYDSYSYSGVSQCELFVHATRKGAEEHAAALGLAIVEYCENPDKQATISHEELRA